MPDDFRMQVAQRYIDCYEKLTGEIQYLETVDNVCADYHTFFRRLST